MSIWCGCIIIHDCAVCLKTQLPTIITVTAVRVAIVLSKGKTAVACAHKVVARMLMTCGGHGAPP